VIILINKKKQAVPEGTTCFLLYDLLDHEIQQVIVGDLLTEAVLIDDLYSLLTIRLHPRAFVPTTIADHNGFAVPLANFRSETASGLMLVRARLYPLLAADLALTRLEGRAELVLRQRLDFKHSHPSVDVRL